MTASKDPIALRILTEAGIISQLSQAMLEKALPDGLKVSQFTVLNHLVRLGGKWSPLRLANAFQVTSGAMTNTLKRLLARGLITLEEDPDDGRAKLVGLTPEGEAMRGRCIEAIGPLIYEINNLITEEEAAAALPVLQKIRAHLDAKRG